MSSVILTGDTSGTLTVSAPLVAGSNTVTLPAATGTISLLTQATSVSASGTSVDFTSIPSWVKRITVMFNAVSTSGTSNLQIRIGSGSVTTSGYVSNCHTGNSSNSGTVTSGFILTAVNTAATSYYGFATINLLASNIYVESHSIGGSGDYSAFGGGGVTLGGALDRVRITTVNGTDTFDAGTINIIYEG